VAAKVKWPFYFSPRAKHLMLRCFEVDPLKRIRVEEILEHPWMEQYKNLI